MVTRDQQGRPGKKVNREPKGPQVLQALQVPKDLQKMSTL